jgi:hypothetical protein
MSADEREVPPAGEEIRGDSGVGASPRNGPESRGAAASEVLRIARETWAAHAGSYSATSERVNHYPRPAGAL